MIRKIICFAALIGNSLTSVDFPYFDQLVDLEGYWRFEIGDNPRWANIDYDDHYWEKIRVPSTWEDEGFPGYNGYAWYRTSFSMKADIAHRTYYLRLGYIDDVDETYLNGHLIGSSGGFPPRYETRVTNRRQYLIPREYLNFQGENILAVRVYDDWDVGGIKRGAIGIYIEEPGFEAIVDLTGRWKFKPGDRKRWKENNYRDRNWDEIVAPMTWEPQGYEDLDGFAWYRKRFYLDKSRADERLVLLLGYIDDMDETFVNGQLVGQTGRMYGGPDLNHQNDRDYVTLRAYYLPREVLKPGEENLIAIRVWDGYRDGGISSGPLAIITRDQYLKWRKRIRYREDNINIEWFIELFK